MARFFLLLFGLAFLIGCGGPPKDPLRTDHPKRISVRKAMKTSWRSDKGVAKMEHNGVSHWRPDFWSWRANKGVAKMEQHLIADPVVYSGSEHRDFVIVFGGGRYNVWLGEGIPGSSRAP